MYCMNATLPEETWVYRSTNQKGKEMNELVQETADRGQESADAKRDVEIAKLVQAANKQEKVSKEAGSEVTAKQG